MTLVERFNTSCNLPNASAHYDPLVFPGQSSWFCLLEKHVLPPGTEVLIYSATQKKGMERTILALMRCRQGVLGVKVLTALQNYYTPDYRPLCSSRSALAGLNSLVTQMLAEESPDVVCLSPLDAESPEIKELQKALVQNGFALEIGTCLVNWIHDVDGSYEQYIAGRPKRVQNTLKRRTRKLLSISDVNIEICDGSKELPRLVEWYEAIYSRSWKNPEPHPRFMPSLITQSASTGELRLGFVSIGGRPIAMHFWIVNDQCAFIYKLAHDKEFDNLSPGSVLMGEMLRYVIEIDGVSRIDFLTGDDVYKRDWMSHRRVKIEIRAYNRRSVRGAIRFATEIYVKPFVKQFKSQLCRTGKDPQQAVE